MFNSAWTPPTHTSHANYTSSTKHQSTDRQPRSQPPQVAHLSFRVPQLDHGDARVLHELAHLEGVAQPFAGRRQDLELLLRGEEPLRLDVHVVKVDAEVQVAPPKAEAAVASATESVTPRHSPCEHQKCSVKYLSDEPNGSTRQCGHCFDSSACTRRRMARLCRVSAAVGSSCSSSAIESIVSLRTLLAAPMSRVRPLSPLARRFRSRRLKKEAKEKPACVVVSGRIFATSCPV